MMYYSSHIFDRLFPTPRPSGILLYFSPPPSITEQSPPCDGSINVTDDDLVGALPQVDGAHGGAGPLDHCGHREFRLIHT